MNEWFVRLRKALYGVQTSEPIVQIMSYVNRKTTEQEIESAKIISDINSEIRSGTTNQEVITARGTHQALHYRIDALERQIEYAKEILNM